MYFFVRERISVVNKDGLENMKAALYLRYLEADENNYKILSGYRVVWRLRHINKMVGMVFDTKENVVLL